MGKPEESKYPKRAHSITIDAGADTLDDLLAALQDIRFKVKAGIPASTTGCSRFGYHFDYAIDPEMTHDRYMEEIEKVGGE